MSTRTVTWIAWSLWALCVALAASAVVLALYRPPMPLRSLSEWGALQLGRGHRSLIVDLSDGWGFRSLVPPREHHRLDHVWSGSPVRDRGVRTGLLRVRAVSRARLAAR